MPHHSPSPPTLGLINIGVVEAAIILFVGFVLIALYRRSQVGRGRG